MCGRIGKAEDLNDIVVVKKDNFTLLITSTSICFCSDAIEKNIGSIEPSSS